MGNSATVTSSHRAEVTDTPEVARAVSGRGEVVLVRRQRDGALELRVNGVFVMDTVETATERLLARTTLSRLHAPQRKPPRGGSTHPLHVVIGGLGLGFTLDEVLRDAAVTDVVVVEIEAAIVDWHRDGLIPPTSGAFADPRVRAVVGDVIEVMETVAPASVDAVLLDVDNGPGFLVYDANAAVYRAPFLRACQRAIKPGGVTAVWSSSPSAKLSTVMAAVFADVEELAVPVLLGARETTYHLFLGGRD